MGHVLLLTTFEDGSLNTASTGGLTIEELLLSWDDHRVGVDVIDWLREWVDSLVVICVVSLSIGGLVHLWVGPGVLWGGPVASLLDGDVVGASADSEETTFSPVLSPRVTHTPELLAVLLTIADDGDGVHLLLVASLVAVDATCVLLEGLWDGDSAGDWSTLVDLLHHFRLSLHGAELVDLVGVVCGWDVASLAWVAVTARLHGGAARAVVVTLG